MSNIFFIGSGVSAHFGMPDWKHILGTAARNCLNGVELKEVEDLLIHQAREYKAATCIAKYVGEARLEMQVTYVLQTAQQKIEDSLPVLKVTTHLVAPTSIGVITTNWDTLLDNLAGLQPLSWPDRPEAEEAHLREIEKYIYEGKKFVWHLHGVIGKPLIVTEDQRKSRAKSINKHRRTIEALLAPHDLVILGSVFSDPIVVKVVNDLVKIGRQYSSISALLRKERIATERKRLAELVPGIEVHEFLEPADFYESLVRVTATRDECYELIQLNPKSSDDLLRKLKGYAARQDLVFSLKDAVIDLPKVTTLAGKAVIEGFKHGNTEVASILSMLLTISADQWHPRHSILNELRKIVRKQLSDGDIDKFHHVQPLAFALGQKGLIELAGSYLARLVGVPDLQFREYLKTSAYFGSDLARHLGYKRHLCERTGLLGAWDLPSQIWELQTASIEVIRDHSLRSIRESLRMLGQFDPKVAVVLENQARALALERGLTPRKIFNSLLRSA